MAPGPYFYIVYNLVYLLSIITCSLVRFHKSFHYTIRLTALFSADREDWYPSFRWGQSNYLSVCKSVFVTVKRQRLSTFTSLLISKFYWFDKPRFVNEGKLLLTTSTPSFGALPNTIIIRNHHTISETLQKQVRCPLLCLCNFYVVSMGHEIELF